MAGREEGRILESPFPHVDVPDVSVTDFLDQYSWFSQRPDAIALIGRWVGQPHESNEWRLSYRELRETVRRVASGLARRGLRKGDVVLAHSSNCPEYLILVLAVYSLGAVMTHGLPGCLTEEILYKLDIAKFCGTVKFYVVASDLLTTAKEVLQSHGKNMIPILIGNAVDKDFIPFTDLLEDNGDSFPKDNRVESGDLAAVLYSSGTTGPPKGVPWTHKQLVAQMSVRSINVREEDVFLLSVPLAHVGGTVLPLNGFSHGAAFLAIPYLSTPEHYSKAVNKHKVTFLFCIPPMIVSLVKNRYDLPTLQRCDTGGSTCGPGFLKEAKITYPGVTINASIYGMTECGAIITASQGFEAASNKRGCLIGNPVANSQAKVVDSITKELLPCGSAGELCLRNPYIMRGYINNPEATARTIDSDGWLHTGDLAQYDDDGFIYIIDRLKDIIRIVHDKTITIQVSPSEVEDMLMRHPGVGDVAVAGIPDPDNEGYELIRAFVVRRTDEVSAGDLVDFVKEKTPRKNVTLTGGVRFIKNVPKNTVGKNMRSELQAQPFE
ncbi:PREDICTED: 4-coumarate--CoA ligase 1-like [Priapulus caudatus]|uniref:4-coumarate--CoA ligase 1-like n=1 Tax=Priapulus caudatus TaxID=37621 RepID=A0ABM1DUP8_PRICU|nr:PREDICTED: 4-coumarate--CoA ligase 1-like [Priapulus caudatus]